MEFKYFEIEFEYFEIEFEDGEYAYIEEENLEKAKAAAEKIGGCKLTGVVVDEDTSFYNEYDIY